MKYSLILLFLFSFVSLYSQPTYDDPCNPKDINSCIKETGTTLGATTTSGFVHTGNCDVDNLTSVYFEFQVDYDEPYVEINLSNTLGNPEVAVLFGKWVTDCDSLFQTYGEYCGPASEALVSVMGIEEDETYYIYVGTSANSQSSFNISACPTPLIECGDNDICSQAIDLGALNGLIQNCMTGCNTGIDDNEVLGDCDHEGVVWYKVTAGSGFDHFYVNVSTSNNITPVYQVYSGDCTNLIPVGGCQFGNFNGPQKVIATPNTTYYIGVSSYFVDSPEFNICLTSSTSGSACVISHEVIPTNTSLGSPLYGPYQACEEVSFCYKIEEYTAASNGCQWLQGVIPILGNGWAPESFDSEGRPQNSTLVEDIQEYDGVWDWYTDVSYNANVITKTIGDFDNDGRLEMCHDSEADCSNNGIVAGDIMPGGWYADNPVDGGDSGHPNVDWGDGSGCGNSQGPWNICFTLTAICADDCSEDDCLDASVKIYTTSDGETGSWNGGISVCSIDEPAILSTTIIPATTFNELVYIDQGANYTKITNASDGYDYNKWQLESESIFKTASSIVFLIAESNATFNVALIANSGITIEESVQSVNIAYYPSPTMQIIENSGCINSSVIIEDHTSNNIVSRIWNIPDGQIINQSGSTIEVQFENKGSYDVSLIVIDENGNEGEITLQDFIVIDSDPTIGFDYNLAGPILTMSDQSSEFDYVGYFINGVLVGENSPAIIHEFTESNIYEIKFLAISDCKRDSIVELIYVNINVQASSSVDVNSNCSNIPFHFTNTTTQQYDSIRWTFPGGSPSTSTENEVTVQYENAGNYDATLTVFNGIYEDTDVIQLEVFDSPLAIFNYDLQGNILNLENMSTPDTDLVWMISGLPDTISDDNPIVPFTENGHYEVTLIATNICGTDTTYQEVTVNIFPEVEATANVDTICVGKNIEFDFNLEQDIDSILWTFPGAIIEESSDYTVTNSYLNAGDYQIYLTVFNAFGQDSDTLDITIGNLTEASFVINQMASVIEISNTSIHTESFHWSVSGFPDTILQENPILEFSLNGIYEILLITQNNCGSDTTMQNIEITGFPEVTASSDIETICVNENIQFQFESSQDLDSILWNFPGATISQSSDSSLMNSYSSAGMFQVFVTVFNDFGQGSDTLDISVIENTTAAFTLLQNNSSVEITNNSTHAEIFQWSVTGFPDTILQENPILEFTSNGTYEIVLITENSCNIDTFTEVLMFADFPECAYELDSYQGCTILEVLFIDQTPQSVSTRAWTFEGGMPATSIEDTVLVSYSVAGSYGFSLQTFNEFGSDSIGENNTIVVFDSPIVDFDYDPLTGQFTAIYENGSTFYWDFGDLEFSTEENPIHIFGENGTFTVKLTVSNELCSTTITKEINILIDAVDQYAKPKIEIYPNPVFNHLHADISKLASGEYDISIIDLSGYRLLETTWFVEEADVIKEINFDFQPGMYYLMIEGEGFSHNVKFIAL